MDDSGQIFDLFCGCGGLSLSARVAGFGVSLSIDNDPIITSSYTLNFPRTKIQMADIAKTSGHDLIRLAGRRPIGIVGGPPCQGFSAIGKRDKNDPRNDLIWHFFRVVAEIRPQFFLMENVPGLLFPDNVNRLNQALQFVDSEYEVLPSTIYDAADFGGATRRRRAVVVGYRRATVDRPKFPHKVRPTSVKDAISDLPGARPHDRSEHDWMWWRYDCRIRRRSEFANLARRVPKLPIGASFAISMLRKGYITGCMETWHTKQIRRRFSKVPQGGEDLVSRYPRLSWHRPATTLRAGTGSDRGSFQAARPIHPTEDRVITVREGARLQGFPDWFLFHPTKWHSFRMIGNSVSPDMGVPIMKALFQASCNRKAIAAE